MKTDGSDWKEKMPPEKSEVEEIFDNILFYRGIASLAVERFCIIKELERLLSEDQSKFSNYLSEIICLYEIELKAVLDVPEDGIAPVPEELQDLYYDKNTSLARWLFAKRQIIFDPLRGLRTLFNKGQKKELAEEIKIMRLNDKSFIFNAKNKVEKYFPILENLTLTAIKDSSDYKKNEELKKSLEEMRNDLISNGFNI